MAKLITRFITVILELLAALFLVLGGFAGAGALRKVPAGIPGQKARSGALRPPGAVRRRRLSGLRRPGRAKALRLAQAKIQPLGNAVAVRELADKALLPPHGIFHAGLVR